MAWKRPPHAVKLCACAGFRVNCRTSEAVSPLPDGRSKITNLPWVIDESTVAKELQLESVHLMNDLEAIAFAIPSLRTGDVHTINAGAPVPTGTIGVIAPGTGLGEAFLIWEGSRYIAHASEGGHASYAPTDETQLRKWTFD